MTNFRLLATLAFFLFIFTHSPSYGASIVCETDVYDTRDQLVIESNNDIYAVSKIDLQAGFRLAGQFLPELNKFKLYAYTYSKDRYVLLIAQEFDVSEKTCQHSFGKNLVYGEPYEQELFFQCYQACK